MNQFDYKRIYSLKTPHDWAARCMFELKCKLYTWSPRNGGTCWLTDFENFYTDSSPEFADVVEDLQYGFMEKKLFRRPAVSRVTWREHRSVFWSDDCDFRGEYIASIYASFDECIYACAFHPRCNHFNWAPHSVGKCTLKSSFTVYTLSVVFGPALKCGFVKKFEWDLIWKFSLKQQISVEDWHPYYLRMAAIAWIPSQLPNAIQVLGNLGKWLCPQKFSRLGKFRGYFDIWH